jgi:hypothetical protein
MKEWTLTAHPKLIRDVRRAKTNSKVYDILRDNWSELSHIEKSVLRTARGVIRDTIVLRYDLIAENSWLARYDAGWKQLFSSGTSNPLFSRLEKDHLRRIDKVATLISKLAKIIRLESISFGIVPQSIIFDD